MHGAIVNHMTSEISLEPGVPVRTNTSTPTSTSTSPNAFAMRFTSTRRGARLARRLVSQRLDSWGYPYDGRTNETLTAIAAELCANAVRHGHVPGRDFHVRLTETAETAETADTAMAAPTMRTLRVEVSDTRTERMPPSTLREPPLDAESGWGLLLVAQLATGWGVARRDGAPGKTVWAELQAGCAPGAADQPHLRQ